MTDYSSEDFWKGAPADAQAFMPGSYQWIDGWWKKRGDQFYFWPFALGESGGWASSYARPFDHPDVVMRPAPQWSGDGLPPVGVFVRITDDGSLRYGSNESGEVIAHVEDCAVVRMSYGLGCFTARYLEPIKTPAQIAAEEREAAIEAMWKIYWQPDAPTAKEALGLLWDAGLRFPKGDDK